ERVGAAPLPGPVAAAGVGRALVRLASVSSLALPGLDLGPGMVALISLAGVSRAGGRRVDGTLGFNVFQRRAVEVDYAQQRLRLHEPGTFAPTGRVALAADTTRRIPLVDATLEVREGIRVPARLVVDLG